jgi:hypothetical protein
LAAELQAATAKGCLYDGIKAVVALRILAQHRSIPPPVLGELCSVEIQASNPKLP